MLSFFVILAALSVILAVVYAVKGLAARCCVAGVCLCIFLIGYLTVGSHRDECAKQFFQTRWCG